MIFLKQLFESKTKFYDAFNSFEKNYEQFLLNLFSKIFFFLSFYSHKNFFWRNGMCGGSNHEYIP